MPKEYSKQEIVDYLKSISVDGMIPHDKAAEMIHEARFPDSLFANGVEVIKQREADDKRQRELFAVVHPRIQEVKALLSQATDCLLRNDVQGNRTAQAKAAAILDAFDSEIIELAKVSARLNSK